jgi:hypothetical protein
VFFSNILDPGRLAGMLHATAAMRLFSFLLATEMNSKLSASAHDAIAAGNRPKAVSVVQDQCLPTKALEVLDFTDPNAGRRQPIA